MPTQVFIVTSDGASAAARDIEEKLKRRETVVVIRETRAPKIKDVGESEVLYFDEALTQTAQYMADLLREQGLAVGAPKKSEAGATLFKKRVEIVLAEEKKAEPKAAPVRRKSKKPARRR